MKFKRCTIDIPHLNFTVKVRPLKPHPDGFPARAWVDHVDNHNSIIYLPPSITPGLVAHEVVHVLQHICHARDIQFLRETEHMGYLTQHIVNRIFGYTWVRTRRRG